MIERRLVEKTNNAYYWVENILANYKDYFLTKEELFAQMPKDDNEVSLISISALENALRNLAKCGEIDVEYFNGKRCFGYREERKRYDR